MKTYFIKTFGCQMNVSDSERIAGFLEAQKFKPTDDIKKANLVIFNTCGVRQTAEDRVYGQIHNLVAQNAKLGARKTKPKIILTGCLANRKDVRGRLKDKVDLFCEIKDFPKKIKELIQKKIPVELSSDSYRIKLKEYLSIKPKYSNKHTAFVPIMTGCNNFCSYCVVPYARGREISRPVEDIIKEINNLIKNGCKEIILLGQNVNSYNYVSSPHLTLSNDPLPRGEGGNKKSSSPFGRGCRVLATGEGSGDKAITFPILLDYLAKNYPQTNFKFLTSHPKDFSKELIGVIARNKNISREIHLPIQSGSDKILKLMNRPYTQKKYLTLIQKIKKLIIGASFTTDVIVGFPGETKKDFAETVKVFKKVKYNEAYINKYSPRPDTAAWKLGDPIAWEEKKRREKILRNLIK